jgi:putative SOS response-associated peptidase YedK
MCNLLRVKHSERLFEFASRYALDDVFDPASESGAAVDSLPERVSPWDNVRLPVVYEIAEGRTLDFMRWGVWPFYEKTKPKGFANSCNARDDSLFTKAIWRRGVAQGRCLVPADGFFEWTGPKGAKWRVLFHRPDDDPFFVAGVWDRDPADGSRGFALVTTRPTPQLAALPHDRMPVILDHDAALAWIGREPLPEAEALALCRPYGGELIRADDPKPQERAGKTKITKSDLSPPSGELSL